MKIELDFTPSCLACINFEDREIEREKERERARERERERGNEGVKEEPKRDNKIVRDRYKDKKMK